MSSTMGTSNYRAPDAYKFELGEGIKLQANVSKDSNGCSSIVEIQLVNCPRPLVLHWGGIYSGQTNWVFPDNSPPGTKIYKKNALQTPFIKRGEIYSISIELQDPKIVAIEFVLKDEGHQRWFKLSQGNFRIDIRKFETTIPKDLVDQKAYLMWESRGRQKSSPQEEKDDFEAALKELQRELSRGLSLDEIRRSLKESQTKRISNDKMAPMPANTMSPSVYHKRHDVSQWLTKRSTGNDKSNRFHPSALLSIVETTVGGENIHLRESFTIGNNELVVLLKNVSGEYNIIVAVDLKGTTVLHWGVSRMSALEWLAPPSEILPESSRLLEGACQTYFKESQQGPFQYVDINLKGRNFMGVQFVLWSGGSWLKNNGSNFFINLEGVELLCLKGENGTKCCTWVLHEIAKREKDAERSLMHRFNIATELTLQCRKEGEIGLVAILVWLRFMACRQLCWNKNYNVKPREISAAQDKFTDVLQKIFMEQIDDRDIVRLIMATVGCGGQGDLGQRIRDEILVIQRNNDCKGGMMEEWHQKLHNNSSPDDIIICQALLNYVRSNFDMDVYWRTLNSNGLTRQILASYDRPIVTEPHFRDDLKERVIHDLTAYLKTLKAVHSGADLGSSISTCLGHSSKNLGFMNKEKSHSFVCLPKKLEELLIFIQEHGGDRNICSLLEKLLEARGEIRTILLGAIVRLKDFIYLDLALDLAIKTSVEKLFNELNNASLQEIMPLISLMLENLCLSTVYNEDLIYATKDWQCSCKLYKPNDQQWSLQTQAVLDRLQVILADKAQDYQRKIQPSAEYLGNLLRIEKSVITTFTEELIRAGSGATLSTLITRLNPALRNIANLGSWQIISPGEVCGFIDCVNRLIDVQSKLYNRPTILVSNRVTGEEEIPEGVVGVLTPDQPDVLSHISIRARNNKVLFASFFDQNILQDLRQKKGKEVFIKLTTSGLIYSEAKISLSSLWSSSSCSRKGVLLKNKTFTGKFAITAQEFCTEMVGAKSINIEYLRGRIPPWIKFPISVALPFGAFEASISAEINKDLYKKVLVLIGLVNSGDISKLQSIKDSILEMKVPIQLLNELKYKMKSSKLSWPGDEGEGRWNQAWQAIKKVWASKWNERAYISCRKAKLNHDDLCMAVLVQEVIGADYAFVSHTRNPLSGNSSEIYTEVVKGLGETLVGAYPGRAMSFITKKSALGSPIIISYPSKNIGMYIKKSLIFRSDSNGEDLKGYAGAGLYDSETMDDMELVVLDYSRDRLIHDKGFQQSVFQRIAEAGKIIEGIYGSAQDIEGVVKDGEIYVVQTRPQV
ncbi:alpha-glucan water dikinase 2 isoform X1 [Typha latifolia]|uniref:alpha-glucan water dikinase 2 isoform X1 n=1 Tax=Typha latifolia TaxID=4733 RepID=UPI003C2AF623